MFSVRGGLNELYDTRGLARRAAQIFGDTRNLQQQEVEIFKNRGCTEP